jgi:hypothetical protein
VKPSRAVNDNLIERTRNLWQPRLGCDLSGEDARQITSPANDGGAPTIADDEAGV